VLVGAGALILFIAWALRAYIRRALYIEGLREAQAGQPASHNEPVATPRPASEARISLTTLIRPIQAGIVDLRSVGAPAPAPATKPSKMHAEETQATIYAFLKEYRMFFAFIVVVSAGWVFASAYFTDVLTYERTYEITIEEVE